MSPEERTLHCRRIAALGGRATVAAHGREHMAHIGKRGFATTIQRYGAEITSQLIGQDFERKYGRAPDAGAMKKREQHARDRVRAACRRLYPALTCDVCGQPAQRHHIHGTAAGNGEDNIRGLCEQHHIEEERHIRQARKK